MAFENAIITKEDDEKYGLSKIYYKYNPYYETFINELRWTIDRDADCWLWTMTMALILKEFGFYIITVKLLKSLLIMISTKH